MSLQDIVGKNCIFLVKHFPFALLYHNMSLKMSFGIHKSSFFTFHGPKKHNIFSNIFQAQNIGIE